MTGYVQVRSDLPYTEEQYRWARRRPAPLRTPIPGRGDEVFYRHDELGPVFRAEVVEVQSLEDFTDPNLWYGQLDAFGQPVLIEGRPVLAKAFDPWPLVVMRVRFPGLTRKAVAREARLPGATGWLPLDWEFRQLLIPGAGG